MEEMATVTNLRVLGIMFAVLFLALVGLFYRYRKINRRRRGLEGAVKAQRQGLRLRDHMLADADAYRLIVDPELRIIIRAGNASVLGPDLSDDIDLDAVVNCFAAASGERLRLMAAGQSANTGNGKTGDGVRAFEKLTSRDGRDLRCRASTAEAHDAQFQILEFSEPKEINRLEKQLAAQQHSGAASADPGPGPQIKQRITANPSGGYEVLLDDLADTEGLANLLAGMLGSGDVLCLAGELGAGKTAFARFLLRALGVREEVTSPTFTLVHPYECRRNGAVLAIWHVDLYRLSEPDAVLELGLEDAFSEALCLIEWPDRLGEFRPGEYFQLTLAQGPRESQRIAHLEAIGSGAQDRLGQLLAGP